MRIVTNPKHRDCEIHWPDEAEMRESAALLERNCKHDRLLKGLFGVLDDCCMKFATCANPYIQKAYLEGFTQADKVNNLLVWRFRDEINHAAMNYPRSWHDSKAAAASGLYYTHLKSHTSARLAILGTAFFLEVTRPYVANFACSQNERIVLRKIRRVGRHDRTGDSK